MPIESPKKWDVLHIPTKDKNARMRKWKSTILYSYVVKWPIWEIIFIHWIHVKISIHHHVLRQGRDIVFGGVPVSRPPPTPQRENISVGWRRRSSGTSSKIEPRTCTPTQCLTSVLRDPALRSHDDINVHYTTDGHTYNRTHTHTSSVCMCVCTLALQSTFWGTP